MSVKQKTRRIQPPVRSAEHDELIKALIIEGLEAFEESFRRQYPEASQKEIRDHMTRYLCERTRFEQEHPRRSFRFSKVGERGVASDGFEHVSALGIRANSTVELLKRIDAGISFKCVERFQRLVEIPLREVAPLLQISPRTLVRRKNEGRLHPDESHRLVRVSQLFQLAVQLFEGNAESARSWLSSPHKAFRGETPLAFARTDRGMPEVENLIGRLEHGVYS